MSDIRCLTIKPQSRNDMDAARAFGDQNKENKASNLNVSTIAIFKLTYSILVNR